MTSDKRLAALPDIPTLAEAGVKGVDVGVWQGVLAPAGTPPAIIGRLAEEIAKALDHPDVRARLVAQSADIVPMAPDRYGAYLRGEAERWTRFAKDNQISLD